MKFSFIKCAGALLAGALLAVACSKDYEADIKRIEDKVDGLTASFNADVPNLQQQITALQQLVGNTDVVALKKTVDEQKQKYDDLLQKYNDLDKKLKDYATKEELTAAIANVTKDLEDQGGRIAALETQIAKLPTTVKELVEPYLEALKAEIKAELDALKGRVENNEKALQTLNEVTIPAIQELINTNKQLFDAHVEDANTFKKQTNEAIQLINDALTEIRGILDTKVDKDVFEAYKENVAKIIAALDTRVETNEKDIKAIKDILDGIDKDNAIWNEIAKKVNQEDFNTFQADVIGRFAEDEKMIAANALAIIALNDKVDSLDAALNATIEKAKADAIKAANDYTDGKIDALELKMRQELADSLVDVANRLTAAYEKADQDLYDKITAEYEAADALLRADIDDLDESLTKAWEQIGLLWDAFDELEQKFIELRDELCNRMDVLEKQMDEILGRIQSVQYVPEYNDMKLSLNLLPFYNDFGSFWAFLPVESEITFKINPADAFESTKQIEEAIEANLLDLNFDVVYVKTRASASWADGPDVEITKIVNYDPKTGFLTMNVMANPQMLTDYLMFDKMFDLEPTYLSVNDFLPAEYDIVEGEGYWDTILEYYEMLSSEGGLFDMMYNNGYEDWWSGIYYDFRIPVYNVDQLEQYDFYKYYAENYAISLEIRRDTPKEATRDAEIDEEEGEEEDEYEYNPNGKFDADQKQAIEGTLNNIASPYVLIYPNVIGQLQLPFDAYRPTGDTETVYDVNGKPVEVTGLELFPEEHLTLPYSATAQNPAYEKNADGKYEPYYYRTPLNGMVPAYEFCDEDGNVQFAVTYQDALKLGMFVPALTLRDQVATRYYDSDDYPVDRTYYDYEYNDDNWGCTWFLVDDEMEDDRIITKGKKYFMAPYEEVTLADGSTKVAQDVYATVMMDANTKASVRRNAIGWTVATLYYVDVAGFGNEMYGYNEDGYWEDDRWTYYYGDVEIVKPSLDVDGKATIKWVYAEDAAEDHARAFGEGDTEYYRALVTIALEDLEFVDKEEPVAVLTYLDEAFNLGLGNFVADGSQNKVKAAENIEFAEGDAEYAAYDPEENPEILAVWLVDANGKKVDDAAKAKGIAFDINNFEWDKVYNYLATYETKYLDVNFHLELTTVDRKHDPIVITLKDHYFDVNGEEFEDGIYSYAETKDKDGVVLRQAMMDGFINLGILSKKEIKDLAGDEFPASPKDADYYDAFFAIESADPAVMYSDQIEQDWVEAFGYKTDNNRFITFEEDPTTVNAEWTPAQLKAYATANGGTVYQTITADGKLVIYLITYVGQMVEFHWNVGYDVPHYDFIHQDNYTFYDAAQAFYWSQASPDYQNAFGSDAVHKLGHYDVMKMDVYANCFNIINDKGQILDREVVGDRFFNDEEICIEFRYGKVNANGVYDRDEATMAEALEEDDAMNVGIEYVNGVGETVSIAKYGDLWVDSTTFYYSSVREQFKMKGFLAVMSGDTKFEIPTSFETAGTILTDEENEAVQDLIAGLGLKINGEIPYKNFELRQYAPFEFPEETAVQYLDLTTDHVVYTINLYDKLRFNDRRPAAGWADKENGIPNYIRYEMLDWDQQGLWTWVVGNGGEDTPSAESNGFQYAPGNDEPEVIFVPGYYEGTYPWGQYVWPHFEANPDYVPDLTVTSATAYDIKKTFELDPYDLPADLVRRITIDEATHTLSYDYQSQVLFSGTKTVPVSFTLFTRWMRPHTFDIDIVIRGLDAQPAEGE